MLIIYCSIIRADDQAHKLTTYKLPTTYYIAKMIKKQKYRVLKIEIGHKIPLLFYIITSLSLLLTSFLKTLKEKKCKKKVLFYDENMMQKLRTPPPHKIHPQPLYPDLLYFLRFLVI